MTFHSKIMFYSEQLLAPRATPKLEDHSMSGVQDCLFNTFTDALHIWRAPPPSETWGCAVPCRAVPCHAALTRDPLHMAWFV
jgi:hypothetical protein